MLSDPLRLLYGENGELICRKTFGITGSRDAWGGYENKANQELQIFNKSHWQNKLALIKC